MHYYQFNIGDYHSHSSHLDELEDLAYRRMLDYCYLNEIGLPKTVEEIGRLIRMRTHCERIANVLLEFFYEDENGDWRHKRVEQEIEAYRNKSERAKESARKRWGKGHANAMRRQCEGNANHKPLTINHKPVRGRFTPPTLEEVSEYTNSRPRQIDCEKFIDFYASKGWMVGKNKMKDWKACVRTWEKSSTTQVQEFRGQGI